MPKRKCKFLPAYTEEWAFIKRGRSEHESLCAFCNSYISISHGGRSNIIDHIASAKHKSNLCEASTSKDISSFFVKQKTAQCHLISAAELTTAFKIINHPQSFSSVDCTTKLNALMYPDSEIAAKQSNARTKAKKCAFLRNFYWR